MRTKKQSINPSSNGNGRMGFDKALQKATPAKKIKIYLKTFPHLTPMTQLVF